MDYAEFKASAAELGAEVTRAASAVKAVPGIGSGPMGLTPDAVKARPDYRQAKAAYERAFAALRAFNAANVKRFEKEARAERAERDARFVQQAR